MGGSQQSRGESALPRNAPEAPFRYRPIVDEAVRCHRVAVLIPVVLLLFGLPVLLLWSPVYGLALWLLPKGGARRAAWLWAWMLPATLSLVILGLTGFIGDVLSSQ